MSLCTAPPNDILSELMQRGENVYCLGRIHLAPKHTSSCYLITFVPDEVRSFACRHPSITSCGLE